MISTYRTPRRNKQAKAAPSNPLEALDGLDCSRAAPPAGFIAAWEDEEAVQGLRNRFVTGDWEAGKARAEARPREASDEEGAGTCFSCKRTCFVDNLF